MEEDKVESTAIILNELTTVTKQEREGEPANEHGSLFCQDSIFHAL